MHTKHTPHTSADERAKKTLSFVAKKSISFNFIACPTFPQCTLYFDVDINAIQTCTDTPRGGQLLQSHGAKTMEAQNPLSFVPSIGIDKVNIESFFLQRCIFFLSPSSSHTLAGFQHCRKDKTKETFVFVWQRI